MGLESSVSAEKVRRFESRSGIGEKAHRQTQELSAYSVLSLESCTDRTEIQKQLAQLWPNIKRELDFIARYTAKDRLVEAISIFSEARKNR
ncbi:MAG: hypothetical protein ABII22_00395, partial [Candidatus Micrarchaeota archaeon]